MSASFGEAAAEDGDEVLPAQRLRHEVPSLAGFGIAGEGRGEQRWRVEFGFHGFRQELDGLLDAAQAGVFFFDTADEVIEVIAGGFGEGVEESYQTVAAKGTSEKWVEGHR